MRRAEVGAGQRVGRFTLRAPLGEGGMGQVWRARDPELERDVAVKVLRPEVASSAARVDEARGRLRREAQAMARLAHPNVLPVYEVGEADAQVFLVMELVDGGTLTSWLAERPRAPAAIIAAFVEAGRGLAAAHDAGLVHRDFKPDNVLVGADGRIRVTDFGLVGHGEAGDAPDDAATSTADVRTRTGAILGTPAYAAPEVLARRPATARSDQFSFAVALYEALYRQPPFAGDTVADLYAAVTGGAVRVPAAGEIPAAVRDALLRALATDPAARWPSMAAFLVALSARPPRRVRGAVAVAVAAVAIGAGAAAVVVTRGSSSEEPRPGSASGSGDRAPPALAPPLQLTSTGGCTESPIVRGDQIVYALTARGREHTYLYKVPLAGGPPVRLTEELLSLPVAGSRPDRVLAVRPDDRVVEVDLTGAITDVPSPPALAAPVGFTWDGETLVYARPDRAQVRAITRGVERALVDLPAGWVAASLELGPDRRWLLVGTGGHSGACVVDLRAATPEARCVELPRSRGSLLIVSADEYLVTGVDGTWRRRFDDAAPPVLVSPSLIEGRSMALAGDGRTVVASHCMRWARLLALAPGGAPRLLADGRFLGPTARADGTIALPRFVDTDDTTLSVRDPNGTFRDLTPPDQIAHDAAWDSTGKLLAYQAAQPDGGGIHVIDLTPFAPRRLTTERTDRSPVFLADGRVAFARMTRPGEAQLFLADPATGAVTPGSHAGRWPYDRHPDGRILVGDHVRHRLWLWDPTTDRETPVSTSDDYAPDSAHVTADGKAVLGVWKNELWRLPLAGGEWQLVYTAANEATVLDGATTLRDGTVVVVERIYRGDLFVSRLPATDEPVR